jgi:hypothetical protein
LAKCWWGLALMLPGTPLLAIDDRADAALLLKNSLKSTT